MVSLIVIDIIKSGYNQNESASRSRLVLKDFSGNVMEESVNDTDISSQHIKVGDQVHFEMDRIDKESI